MIQYLLLLGSAFALWPLSPEQVHISYAEEDSSMYVTWAAFVSSPFSQVQWQEVDGPQVERIYFYRHRAYGNWRHFKNLHDLPISRILNSCYAKITGLESGKFYQYTVGSWFAGWSEPQVFQAKRQYNAGEYSKFLVFGDIGVHPQIDDTLARLKQETQDHDYDSILFLGDMAYEINDDDGWKGDIYLNTMQEIIGRFPYMITQGNHEGPDLGATQHYMNRFKMPGDSYNFWYSFDIGLTHFLVYSTEFAIHPTNEVYPWDDMLQQQLTFMEEDLSKVDRSRTPWVVTLAHRPFYCSADWTVSLTSEVPWERHNKDCLGEAEKVRNQFEEVVNKYQTDLMLFGHVHSYERMAPVYQNATVASEQDSANMHVNPKAPVLIITGIPGQNESYAPISKTPLPWSQFQTSELGYGRLTVFNRTHLLFEEVVDDEFKVADYVWIVKDN